MRVADCEGANLEHLDKGNTQVEISEVTADQRQREEKANRHNGPEVYTASHGNFFPRVENVSEAGHDLGHDGSKEKMPCCEENGKV